MTDGRPDIQGRVLENLLDGLVVIERGGAVATFNAAAARILEIPPEEARGRTFGELFVAREGFEELSELILDAVAGGKGGGRAAVSVRIGGAARRLSVATSYIAPAQDGDGEPAALIAVLTDVTELHRLREAERRMADAMKAQNAELQTAYRQVEERSDSLAALLKKVQMARVAATVLVFALFVGAGAYAWRPFDLFDAVPGLPPAAEAAAPREGSRRLVVEPRPVRETVALVGELAPWKTVAVPSPLAGRVASVHFQYGQSVAEGDLLLEVGTGGAVREHREARVAYLDKLKEFESIRDWDKGAEVTSAKRALVRAKLALEDQENRLGQSRFLMEQGLIAASRHEDAERQHRARLLGLEAAREDLDRIRARGEGQTLEKAALELASAEEDMREIAGRLEQARVRAPLSGVVVAAQQAGARPMYPGRLVTEGEALLAIGDFDRMSATAKVDEVDVVRLAVGQAVSVTGDAFPGLRLRGTVTHVSSQPVSRTRNGAEFRVVVTLDAIAPDRRRRLRAGMSSRLQIDVYSNEEALLVPVEAVEAGGGAHRLRVVDPATGEAKPRRVEVGVTTRDSVEIEAGIEAGETILVPGPAPGS